MIWNRRQYIDLMTFGHAPRPMFVELFGPLIGLEDEWRAQGATPEELDLTAFDFDSVYRVDCGASAGLHGAPKPVVLEDSAGYRIERDGLGRTMKLAKGVATIPLPMDYPVKDWESWERVKPYYRFSEERVDRVQLLRAKEEQRKGALAVAGIPGGFNTLRELMGEENTCIFCYEEPDLIRDILSTLTDTSVKCLERVADVLTIDQVSVHEDMAGKSGPLFGPRQVLEFIKPYYSAAWAVAEASGSKLFCQDSDGQMTPVIDAFIECGLTIMYPCEPAAGMDIVALRKKYGARMAFKGGIDKFCVLRGREAIDRELDYKLQPHMFSGNCFSLDHRIPNGTPLADYRYYVDAARQRLGLPRRTSENRGWDRMAF